jgi:hypothetical protein
MKTDLGTVIDATSWDAIFAAAIDTGQIISSFSPATTAGFQSICIWPTVDDDRFIVLIRGES